MTGMIFIWSALMLKV